MITIVSCTKLADYKQTLLYKSLAKLEQTSNLLLLNKVKFFTSNKLGLSEAYNKHLYNSPLSVIDDYALFVHDDVWIDDAGFISKLEEAHKTYDIVGIAGGINPVIKEPTLWHLMCGGFSSTNLRGFAGHYLHNSDRRTMITNFGPTPDRVAIIDGVFMSVNIKRAHAVNWKFNENYTYHLYDLSSCLDANKKKLKIGVAPILIYHNSPGLRSLDDETFKANQQKFMQEFASY